MEANKALQNLDHEALRKVAELGNFSFYALLDVQNRSLKINTENTQRILQAVEQYKRSIE